MAHTDHADSYIPVTEEQIQEQEDQVMNFLQSVRWDPDESISRRSGSKSDEADEVRRMQEQLFDTVTGDSTSSDQEVSIITQAHRVGGNNYLLPNRVSVTMNALKRGLCIAFHLLDLYEESSGLQSLIEQNKRGSGLPESKQAEFRSKWETASCLVLFVTAYYVASQLKQQFEEEMGQVTVEYESPPNPSFYTVTKAIRSLLFYYGRLLERPAAATNSELEFLKYTFLYFEDALETVKARKGSLDYSHFFTENHYKVEEEEFTINGFETEVTADAVSIEFNRVEWDEIVGNRRAKLQARRICERLFTYDLEAEANPMQELGGLIETFMGSGIPGTGKGMIISAMATEMERLSEITGIPFLFHPFPDTVVSTYQGGSAERTKDWFGPMRGTKRIIFAPIDDAENILEDRSNENVSSGVREVISVVLPNLEGPRAVNHGNWTLGVFTNLPEQLDPAVLSRIQKRMTIEGAQTVEDFLDQDYIWWSKVDERFPELIDMQPPEEYDLMSRQKMADSFAEVAEDIQEHSVEEVSALWDAVAKEYDPLEDHRFYGEFFNRLQDEFPFFSSRDVRNIQTAIGTRLMDFDYPDIFWEEPDEFFRQDYETKKQMLLELQDQNLGDLSFAQVRKQEVLQYVHETVDIKQTKFDQMVEDRVEEIRVREEAKKRIQSENGTLA